MNRRKMMRAVTAVLVLLNTGLFAADSSHSLETQIQAVFQGPDYKHAHWGLLAVDLQAGDVLYEWNADRLFAPASTTKLYSVAAALNALGAGHRFETPIYRRGEVDRDGTLKGDLILVASGDLSMGGRTERDGRIAFKDSDHTYANGNLTAELTAPNPLGGLDVLARQVAASGIKQVRGEVWIDDRLFDGAESTGSGPSRVTPIMVNDNLIDFVISPTAPGLPATVTWRPETSAIRVDAIVETAPADAETFADVKSAGAGRYVVRGRIAAGRKSVVRVAEADEPASFARSLLIEALRRAGVRTEATPLGPNRTDLLPPPGPYVFPRVAVLTSPPLSESARLILKVSHNLHASALPLLVAVKHGKRTLSDGLKLQHDFLAQAGVGVDTISFGGGAGGSRADFTTPRATVQLLRYMATRPDFSVYEGALPVMGVDGTLASVVGGESPARGHVHAKTGTLIWENTMNGGFLLTSKALAGYMTTGKGRRLAFAMFVNNTHLARATDTTREGKVLGKLCEVLYQAQ